MEFDPKTIQRIINIKNRYFRKVISRPTGLLCHAGDCDIYRAIEVYEYAPCICGFNFDLIRLDSRLAYKLNPNLGNEHRLQEAGVFFQPIENTNELQIILRSIGFQSYPQHPDDDAEDWAYVAEVFGNEYRDFLQSSVHNQTCRVCGWKWRGSPEQVCSYCQSVKSYRENHS